MSFFFNIALLDSCVLIRILNAVKISTIMPGASYSCSVRPSSVACCVTCPILPCVCACYIYNSRGPSLPPIRAAALHYLYGGRRARLLQRVLAWTSGRFLTFLSLFSFLSFSLISPFTVLCLLHMCWLLENDWLVVVFRACFLCMDNASFF